MDVQVALGVLTLVALGMCSLVGGLWQAYLSLFGSVESLSLGRFRVLFQMAGVDEESVLLRRVFWLVGGSLMAGGGAAFLAVTAWALV